MCWACMRQGLHARHLNLHALQPNPCRPTINPAAPEKKNRSTSTARRATWRASTETSAARRRCRSRHRSTRWSRPTCWWRALRRGGESRAQGGIISLSSGRAGDLAAWLLSGGRGRRGHPLSLFFVSHTPPITIHHAQPHHRLHLFQRRAPLQPQAGGARVWHDAAGAAPRACGLERPACSVHACRPARSLPSHHHLTSLPLLLPPLERR
jgi:hypothetical protein